MERGSATKRCFGQFYLVEICEIFEMSLISQTCIPVQYHSMPMQSIHGTLDFFMMYRIKARTKIIPYFPTTLN